jgi:methionine synthase I (cobalamin-dependent)
MDAAQLARTLHERPSVADGGTGALIYQMLGYPRALCIEHTPLTHPEMVLQIHLAYIAAGAELIQALSYGANRIKLAPYGLMEKAAAINSQAVKLAREAREEGIRISEELLAELVRRPEVSGTYIICPFNRYELALTILDAVSLPK